MNLCGILLVADAHTLASLHTFALRTTRGRVLNVKTRAAILVRAESIAQHRARPERNFQSDRRTNADMNCACTLLLMRG